MNHFDDLFLQAREISDPAARAAFLDEACAHQPELRARLEALLADASAADAFFGEDDTADVGVLARARGLAAAADAADRALASTPTHIGPYRILERIGHGGMGDVFRAVQKQPIRREVALKLIKLGMDTQQVIARFEAERQALALMDHPHIARVLDAGADDQGRPYFVMELVRGVPITQYADEKQLTLRERLALMKQVCQAIQHAHSKGVIHRDLKPSNILVSTQDGRPHAKVIDFGIAKATAQPLTDKTLYTQFQQFIGTPQYMSPEQAEGSLDIDTRSDVYALGILLYELLTGGTPVEAATLRQAALHEIARIIKEQDTPKPSTRLLNVGVLARARGSRSERAPDPRVLANAPTAPVGAVARLRSSDAEGTPDPRALASTPTTTLTDLAKSRSISAESLIKTVRGELDWLVMKALEKDRARRYETPNQLSDDIARYLEGQPIVAAPPSSTYRMQKFIRKHRAPVLAAAAVLTLMTAGILGTSWGLVREKAAKEEATQQAKIAEQERTRAEAEKAEADQQRLTAETAKTTAEREREAAELESYIGNLAAAQAALTAHDYPGARARLAVCPEKLRGWEWRFLNEKAKAMLCVLPGFQLPLHFTSDGNGILVYNDATKSLHLVNNEGSRLSPDVAVPENFLADKVAMSRKGDLVFFTTRTEGRVCELKTGKVLLTLPQPLEWEGSPVMNEDGQLFAMSNLPIVFALDGQRFRLPEIDVSNSVVAMSSSGVTVAFNNRKAVIFDPKTSVKAVSIILDVEIKAAQVSNNGQRILLLSAKQAYLFDSLGRQIGDPLPNDLQRTHRGKYWSTAGQPIPNESFMLPWSSDDKMFVTREFDHFHVRRAFDAKKLCTLSTAILNGADFSMFSQDSTQLHMVGRWPNVVSSWKINDGTKHTSFSGPRYQEFMGLSLRDTRLFTKQHITMDPLPTYLNVWDWAGQLRVRFDEWFPSSSHETVMSSMTGDTAVVSAHAFDSSGFGINTSIENGFAVLKLTAFGPPVLRLRPEPALMSPFRCDYDLAKNPNYIQLRMDALLQKPHIAEKKPPQIELLHQSKGAIQETTISDSFGRIIQRIQTHEVLNNAVMNTQATRIIGATQNKIIVWDVHTGRDLVSFILKSLVYSLQMSGDDSQLIVKMKDGTVEIWDANPFIIRQQYFDRRESEIEPAKAQAKRIIETGAEPKKLRESIWKDATLDPLRKALILECLEEMLYRRAHPNEKD